MTCGANNCCTMTEFPGLWTVSGSPKCDLLVGIAAISEDTETVVVKGHVGFRRRGGLVDVAGFAVEPGDLGPDAGLCELRQEPLRTTLMDAAWRILFGL
jgi:hypothetical protein